MCVHACVCVRVHFNEPKAGKSILPKSCQYSFEVIDPLILLCTMTQLLLLSLGKSCLNIPGVNLYLWQYSIHNTHTYTTTHTHLHNNTHTHTETHTHTQKHTHTPTPTHTHTKHTYTHTPIIGHTFTNRLSCPPFLVKGVCALMQGERLDGIAAQLTGFGLQARRDVHLQGAMLTLDGADL